MPRTRTFTVAQLTEWGLPNSYEMPDGMELHREQIDTRRWTSVHQLVFRAPDDGRAWAVTYDEPLTELQYDTATWGEGETEVTGTEMEAREVTVIRWVPADA